MSLINLFWKKKAQESIWRRLSPEEEKEFRQWARDNWKPNTKINVIWHPIVRDEWEKINKEKEWYKQNRKALRLEDFKVGDKILIIGGNEYSKIAPGIGETGEVVDVDLTDVLVEVEFDNWINPQTGRPYWHVSPSRLQKIYTNGRH